jgi:hypothetical protein
MRGVYFVGLIWIAPDAHAHDWYDKTCCRAQDCEPMAEDIIVETKAGFVVPSGELIRYSDDRIRPSRDNSFHWCRFEILSGQTSPQHWTTQTLCLYVPGGF